MDHVLTSDSLTPSPGISKAVLDMPQPENKAATCRFLGTIMYLSKFCPHLSRVVHPLRDLTHLKQQFIWADQHTKAFQEAKLRQLLSLLSAYYLLQMTLAWLYSQSAIPHPQDTLVSGSASAWTCTPQQPPSNS